jgi:membrane protease YdiL (CAAX protease family)
MTLAEAHAPGGRARGGFAEVLLLGITFLWAWTLWGYWVVEMPPGGLQVSAAFIVCAMVGGLAPSLAALVVTAVARRAETGRQLISPLLRWQVDGAALAIALLLAMAAAVASVALQAIFIGPLRWPDPALLTMALIWPLVAALGEELGWRGVLLPRLDERFGLLPAAFIIGIIWGLWHLPADYTALKGYGGWFLMAFLLNGPIILTAHSIIMAWLWRRTSGSLLTAVLYHATITASAIAAPTAGSDGLPGVLAAASLAAVLWMAAILLLLLRWKDFADAKREPGQ